MEIAEGFYQMLNLDDVIVFYFFDLLVFNAWRIEDTGNRRRRLPDAQLQ